MTTKKMFANIDVNIFVPKDPSKLNPSIKLSDLIDDSPEEMERLQQYVIVNGMFIGMFR